MTDRRASPALAPLREALRRAAASCPLAQAVVPTNAAAERARCRDGIHTPAWTYAKADLRERELALVALRRAVADLTPSSLATLYAARADELLAHTRLAACVGTRTFAERLAPLRYPLDAALLVARAWATERPSAEPAHVLTSGPGATLETALRERLAALRIDWPVLVRPAMAALAATGEGFVAVAADRLITEEALARTVAHEIEGHVRPRVAGTRANHLLAGIGSAGGNDAQEGWAILCEERTGHLSPTRKHELGWRTIAAARMRGGEDFGSVRRSLEEEAGFTRPQAYALAERLFRGSMGLLPGLGREAAYVAQYLRVRDHLAVTPGDEALFRVAQVTPEACALLREAQLELGS